MGKREKKNNSHDKIKSREVQMEECFSEHAILIMTVKQSINISRQVLSATEKSNSTLDFQGLEIKQAKSVN